MKWRQESSIASAHMTRSTYGSTLNRLDGGHGDSHSPGHDNVHRYNVQIVGNSKAKLGFSSRSGSLVLDHDPTRFLSILLKHEIT